VQIALHPMIARALPEGRHRIIPIIAPANDNNDFAASIDNYARFDARGRELERPSERFSPMKCLMSTYEKGKKQCGALAE
jgi:hypothetical protein